MVCVAAIGRYQLCHGQWRLGCALRPILVGVCLPVKEWGKPEKPEPWLYVEAWIIGFVMLTGMGAMLYSILNPV
jgi:hypothetical protein